VGVLTHFYFILYDMTVSKTRQLNSLLRRVLLLQQLIKAARTDSGRSWSLLSRVVYCSLPRRQLGSALQKFTNCLFCYL